MKENDVEYFDQKLKKLHAKIKLTEEKRDNALKVKKIKSALEAAYGVLDITSSIFGCKTPSDEFTREELKQINIWACLERDVSSTQLEMSIVQKVRSKLTKFKEDDYHKLNLGDYEYLKELCIKDSGGCGYNAFVAQKIDNIIKQLKNDVQND